MIRAGASRVCAVTQSIRTRWDLVRNASFQAYIKLTESETLGMRAQSSVLITPLG